jgi:phage major head subunit gpT-like protein
MLKLNTAQHQQGPPSIYSNQTIIVKSKAKTSIYKWLAKKKQHTEWDGKARANRMKGKVQVGERKGTRDGIVIKIVLGENSGNVTQPSPRTQEAGWLARQSYFII